MTQPIAFLVLVLIVVIAVMICDACSRASFNARFPRISDAEFMARCQPGSNPAVALKVRRIVADQLGIEYERIHPSAHFVHDLSAD